MACSQGRGRTEPAGGCGRVPGGGLGKGEEPGEELGGGFWGPQGAQPLFQLAQHGGFEPAWFAAGEVAEHPFPLAVPQLAVDEGGELLL